MTALGSGTKFLLQVNNNSSCSDGSENEKACFTIR